MRLFVALLVLVGCASPSMPAADASTPVDAPALPVPVCRPLSENPTCEGDCSSGFYAVCPDGYEPACLSDLSRAHWQRGPDGNCAIYYSWGADCPPGSSVGSPITCPAEARLAVCVPPRPSINCPE